MTICLYQEKFTIVNLLHFFCEKNTCEKSSRRAKFIQHVRSMVKKKRRRRYMLFEGVKSCAFEGAKITDVTFGGVGQLLTLQREQTL